MMIRECKWFANASGPSGVRSRRGEKRYYFEIQNLSRQLLPITFRTRFRTNSVRTRLNPRQTVKGQNSGETWCKWLHYKTNNPVLFVVYFPGDWNGTRRKSLFIFPGRPGLITIKCRIFFSKIQYQRTTRLIPSDCFLRPFVLWFKSSSCFVIPRTCWNTPFKLHLNSTHCKYDALILCKYLRRIVDKQYGGGRDEMHKQRVQYSYVLIFLN